MKKGLLLSFLLAIYTSVFTQTNVYHPFPDSNAFWGDKGWNIFTTSYNLNTRYAINGDTVIIGKNYKKIYSLFDSTLTNPNSIYFAAIREEDKRIYTKIDTIPEQLLYDFNLSIGDTITYHYSLFFHTNETFSRVVTQIDSVLLLDGEYRKRWTLSPAENVYITDDIIVEGIGSIHWRGLFNPLINSAYTNGDMYSFECFKQNDTVLYLDNPVCNHCFCTFLTGIDNKEVFNNAIITPNPFTTSAQITFNQTYQSIATEVYDIEGKLLMQNRYAGCDHIELRRGNLEDGLYFLKLTLDDKAVETRKIIVSE